jgi:hypothetical protein
MPMEQEMRAMPAEPAAAVDTSANPHLGAVVSLPEFNAMTGTLSEAERRTIVNQALVLIDDLYVHLPLKRAAHAVDPVQQLKLLRRRLGALSERQFHDEMINIFKRLRDLHTNYILPAPYNQHTAFLPFLMEEFYDAAGERHYIVTRLLQGFTHPTFAPGVEVVRWSGVPIDRAVEIHADREAGSNEAARHVRGLDNMTVRPMVMCCRPRRNGSTSATAAAAASSRSACPGRCSGRIPAAAPMASPPTPGATSCGPRSASTSSWR